MSCVDGRGGSKACALMQYRVRVEPRSCGGGQGHRSGLAVPPRRAAADADDPNNSAIRVENAAHLNCEILSVENSDACLLMTPKLFRLHEVGRAWVSLISKHRCSRQRESRSSGARHSRHGWRCCSGHPHRLRLSWAELRGRFCDLGHRRMISALLAPCTASERRPSNHPDRQHTT